jgi:hypothetical protein
VIDLVAVRGTVDALPSLGDREFAMLLTACVCLVIIGLWGAIVHTLHEIRAATRVLILRTAQLERHVAEHTVVMAEQTAAVVENTQQHAGDG